MRSLAQVNRGDIFTSTYTEALAYEAKKGGKQGPTTAAALAAPGAKPAGVSGKDDRDMAEGRRDVDQRDRGLVEKIPSTRSGNHCNVMPRPPNVANC